MPAATLVTVSHTYTIDTPAHGLADSLLSEPLSADDFALNDKPLGSGNPNSIVSFAGHGNAIAGATASDDGVTNFATTTNAPQFILAGTTNAPGIPIRRRSNCS